MTERIVIKAPRPKRRAGVLPTRKEADRSKRIPRRTKHRKRPDPGAD